MKYTRGVHGNDHAALGGTNIKLPRPGAGPSSFSSSSSSERQRSSSDVAAFELSSRRIDPCAETQCVLGQLRSYLLLLLSPLCFIIMT